MAYKAHILLSCCSVQHSILPFSGCPAFAIHSQRCLDFRPRRQHVYARQASTRGIEPEDPSWPQTSHRDVPTPYEIFRQKKGSPYSKRRFYELVKIYHPDRDIHHTTYPGRLSRATRLERYRLVISANEILSDPVKRHAYDRWGAGWHGQPQMSVSRNAKDPASEDPRSKFNDDFASAAGNATWEDWERWYRRRDGDPPAEPRYVSNERFVGLVMLFLLIGGSLEFGRAAQRSASFNEQVQVRHAAATEELAKRRQGLSEASSQDERVQDFLRTRDTGYRGDVSATNVQAQSPNSGWK